MTTYEAPERTSENILVVDDYRTMKFDATTVRTLDRAISFLYSKPWDEVWLDHDLDGREDIMPLIKKVEADARNGIILPVGIFIIHTGNPVGRMRMAQALLPWYTVGEAHGYQWSIYPDPTPNYLDPFRMEELFGAD